MQANILSKVDQQRLVEHLAKPRNRAAIRAAEMGVTYRVVHHGATMRQNRFNQGHEIAEPAACHVEVWDKATQSVDTDKPFVIGPRVVCEDEADAIDAALDMVETTPRPMTAGQKYAALRGASPTAPLDARAEIDKRDAEIEKLRAERDAALRLLDGAAKNGPTVTRGGD